MIINQNWNKEDYYTYFLIYAAYADFNLAEEEKEYILDRVSKEEYKKMHRIFKKHNDVEKLEIFDYFLHNFCNEESDKEKLLREMQEVFWADGRFESLEHIFMMYFKKIISDCNTSQIKKSLLN